MTLSEWQREVVFAAQLSRAVYDFVDGKVTHLTNVIDEVLSDRKVWKVANSAAVSGYDERGRLWVGFCGTNELADWLQNTSTDLAHPSWLRGGSIHRGFEEHAHALDLALAPALELRSNAVLCGHSLGSAIAQRFGARYALSQHMDVKVIGIATPRLFSCNTAVRLGERDNLSILRINNNFDLVDNMPLHYGRRYCHAGRGIWVDSKGRVSSEDEAISAFRFLRLIWQWCRRKFPWTTHDADEYLARINKWMISSPR